MTNGTSTSSFWGIPEQGLDDLKRVIRRGHRYERKRKATDSVKQQTQRGRKNAKRLADTRSSGPHCVFLRAVADVVDSHLSVIVHVRLFEGLVLVFVGILALLLAMIDHVYRIRNMKKQGLPPKTSSFLPIGSALALLVIGIAALMSILLKWSL
jgi:hypothetical protein